MFKLQVVQRARCVGADNKGGLCAGSCNEPPALAELFAFGSHLGSCTQPNVTLACFRAQAFYDICKIINNQSTCSPLFDGLFAFCTFLWWYGAGVNRLKIFIILATPGCGKIFAKNGSAWICFQFWVLEISCLVVLRLKTFWQMFTQKVAFGLYLIPSPVQVDKNIERIYMPLCVYCVGFRAA